MSSCFTRAGPLCLLIELAAGSGVCVIEIELVDDITLEQANTKHAPLDTLLIGLVPARISQRMPASLALIVFYDQQGAEVSTETDPCGIT
jgi:hypothetical protein